MEPQKRSKTEGVAADMRRAPVLTKKAKMIQQLDDLSTKAVGYRNHYLASKTRCYDYSVPSKICRMRKSLTCNLRPTSSISKKRKRF